MGIQWATAASNFRSVNSKMTKKKKKLTPDKIIKAEEDFSESMIQFEVRFMSVLPSFLQVDEPKYRVLYEVFYGWSWDRWVEEAIDFLHTSKKAFWFAYSVSQEDQKIYVKISFDFDTETDMIDSQTVIEKNKSKSNKSPKKKFYNSIASDNKVVINPDPERAEFIYKIDAIYDLHSTLMLKGCFGSADYMSSNIPKLSGDEAELKGMDKYETGTNIVRASVVEKNRQTKNITFALTGKFDSEDGFLMVTVYEIIGKHRKWIFETLPITKSKPFNNRPGLFYFEKIEINTDIFEAELISDVILEFELKRVKYNKKQKESFKVIGSESSKLKNILRLQQN
jgi:hypothetical protein